VLDIRKFAALGAAAVFFACAPRATSHGEAATTMSDVSVTVKNDNWLDVAVYLVQGGGRFRIGEAVGNTTARLRIPKSLITGWTIQLMADPIGSGEAYVTDAISVAPDEQVQLVLAPRMRMSSYAVWSR
jgi:hypothetical protein